MLVNGPLELTRKFSVSGVLKQDVITLFDQYGNLQTTENNDGLTYYVDANAGVNTNNGLSWDTSFKTLAAAITASNATIVASTKGTGRGWAARNTIYYKGDNAEAAAETLITLPNKCDVIGVGSYDHRPYPVLIGNHVIGAGAYMGTRFINMGFQSPAAGGVIFTVPATTSGLAFLGCHFDGRGSTPATKAILATGVEQFSVIGCDFIGKYSTTTIDLGTGATRNLRIIGNQIESGAIGITVHASLTCADAIGIISDNTFAVVTLVVDDNSSKLLITRNRGYTAAAKEIATVLDCNELYCSDNVFGNATGIGIYPAYAAIA
jgi:hypothetical protein